MVLSLRTPTFRNFTFAELREDVVVILLAPILGNLAPCTTAANVPNFLKSEVLFEL